ncbi:MAG: FAD-binding protein [Ilumatobacteraceae bacterium]
MNAPVSLSELETIVGATHVLTDPELRAGYELDWTGRHRGEALAVVRPASTEQVADVVRWAAANRIAVVPQGGNTGLVAGAVPPHGSIVLDGADRRPRPTGLARRPDHRGSRHHPGCCRSPSPGDRVGVRRRSRCP